MGIGNVQTTDYTADYAGYAASSNERINNFYSSLTAATEKSDSQSEGEALGLTMMNYSETMSYGMAAFYSDQSTPADPMIRISSNYGGEQRFYDVHVNEVDPRNASQLEMFALSCYQDDQGITQRGTFGSFTRMKAYAGNAAYNGEGVDLQDPEHASDKVDWVAMLERMKNLYVQNSQTYEQYLDCNSLEDAMSEWSDRMQNGDTEVAAPIGGQSFTQKEWKKLMEKVDKNIEDIKEEQKERIEKMKEEEVEKELLADSTIDSEEDLTFTEEESTRRDFIDKNTQF